MKIIDLLNKIANGEIKEISKFIYKGDLYEIYGNEVDTIKKDLERLEKLEEVIDVIKYIKEVLKEAFNIELREPIGNSGSIYISKIKHNKAIVYISKEAYELLKDWLEND